MHQSSVGIFDFLCSVPHAYRFVPCSWCCIDGVIHAWNMVSHICKALWESHMPGSLRVTDAWPLMRHTCLALDESYMSGSLRVTNAWLLVSHTCSALWEPHFIPWLQFHHVRINHSEKFAEERNHINGIENFWSQAKRHMRRFNGIPKEHFNLFLKECEWRFNNPDPKLQVSLLKDLVKGCLS